MQVNGFFDQKFAPVIEQFEKNFTERGDVGGSFALTVEGEYVIDIWAGHMDSNPIEVGPNPNTIWWAGFGGSMVIIDTDAHLCFSYVMNQVKTSMIGDKRASSLGQAVYQGLEE